MQRAQRIFLLVLAGSIVFAAAQATAQEEDESAEAEEAEGGDDAEAAPTAEELEEAKQAFAKGKEYFEADELLNAAKMFKRSYKLSRNPILLYNIAFTTDKLGKLDLAIVYYERFLKEAPEAAPNREEATERMAYLQSQKAKAEKEAAAKAARAAKKAKRAGNFEHNVIEEVPPGKPVDVTAAIPQKAKWQVVLYYRVPGMSEYRRVLMKKRYSELVGRIPASATASTTSLQYYVEASSEGDVVARSGQPTSPHLITVDEAAKARFYPDLEDTTESANEYVSSRPSGGGGEARPEDFWMRWGTTGGAALGIALSLTFYAVSADAANTLEGEAAASTLTDACPDKPCRTYSKTQSDLQSSGKRFETLGHVALGVGVAAAGVAGYYWYRHLSGGDSGDEDKSKPFNPDDSPLSRAQVAPVVTDNFVGGAALIEF